MFVCSSHITAACGVWWSGRGRERPAGHCAAGECSAQVRAGDTETEMQEPSRGEQETATGQRQHCEGSPCHDDLVICFNLSLSLLLSLSLFLSLSLSLPLPPPCLSSPLSPQQAQAEQEEEFISNTLLKKIHSLKKEKEALAMNYEQEEEFLTNDLSRKLAQVRGLGVFLLHIHASLEYSYSGM